MKAYDFAVNGFDSIENQYQVCLTPTLDEKIKRESVIYSLSKKLDSYNVQCEDYESSLNRIKDSIEEAGRVMNISFSDDYGANAVPTPFNLYETEINESIPFEMGSDEEVVCNMVEYLIDICNDNGPYGELLEEIADNICSIGSEMNMNLDEYDKRKI